MLNARIIKMSPKSQKFSPSTEVVDYFMSFKDGVAMEHNLTAAEAVCYRGTDIKVVKQSCFHAKPVFVNGIRVDAMG